MILGSYRRGRDLLHPSLYHTNRTPPNVGDFSHRVKMRPGKKLKIFRIRQRTDPRHELHPDSQTKSSKRGASPRKNRCGRKREALASFSVREDSLRHSDSSPSSILETSEQNTEAWSFTSRWKELHSQNASPFWMTQSRSIWIDVFPDLMCV